MKRTSVVLVWAGAVSLSGALAMAFWGGWRAHEVGGASVILTAVVSAFMSVMGTAMEIWAREETNGTD